MNLSQWIQARAGGRVKRCHTTPTICVNTVAEHSWGVAMIIATLHPSPSVELLKAALLHDVPEYWLGDIPGPTKWDNPEFDAAVRRLETSIVDRMGVGTELLESETMWLKYADVLDLYLYTRQEMDMGNMFMADIRDKCIEILDPCPIPEISTMFRMLRSSNLYMRGKI